MKMLSVLKNCCTKMHGRATRRKISIFENMRLENTPQPAPMGAKPGASTGYGMSPRRLSRYLSAALCTLLLAQPFSAFALDDTARKQRRADLDFLVATLEEKHPDMYANVTREEVAAKQAYIAQNMDKWDDLGFEFELLALTALLEDSHTSLKMNLTDTHVLAFGVQWMDGAWRLMAAPKANQALLGQEITAIHGVPIAEAEKAIAAFSSADNEIKRRRSFGQMVSVWELLIHSGVIPADATETRLTVRDAAGKESFIALAPMTREEISAAETISLKATRETIPVTEADRKSIYKMLDLGEGTLYIQYNQCREDPNLPMAEFAAQVGDALASGRYGRIVIDLRNNGGGSDGVIWPVLEKVMAAQQGGAELAVLIGETTFSSAIINAVQLRQIGATLYGEETSGSVDHFGAVDTFSLPNAGLHVAYSTKYIDMGDYYAAAKDEGVNSLKPDVPARQTLVDYQNGVDTAIQKIMETPAEIPPQTMQATPMAVRIKAEGKEATLAGYQIDGTAYVAMRDLAAALSGSPAQFNLTWYEKEQAVILQKGQAYTNGSATQAQTGIETATAATAMFATEDKMPLALSGAPGAVRAYRIDERHYVALEAFCAKLGLAVKWNGDGTQAELSPQ